MSTVRSLSLARRRRTRRSIAGAAATCLLLSGCGLRVASQDAAAPSGFVPNQGNGAVGTTTVPGDPAAAPIADPAAVAAGSPGNAGAAPLDTAAAAAGGGAAGTATASGGTKGAAGSGGAGGATTATNEAAKGDIAIAGANSQGVSDTAIKIGVLAPISGAAGFLGQNEVDGIAGYLGMVNSQGGVKGRKIQTVVVDTAFDPATDVTGARQLIEQEKVLAAIGVLGDASASYMTAKGVPYVVLGFHPAGFSSKYPTTYPVGPNAVKEVAAMAYYFMKVKKAPIKSTSILYDTQNINIRPWVKFMEDAWKIHGVEVKSTDAFNLSDGNCDQLIVKLRNLNIDFWQAGQSLGWPICLAAAAKQNYKPAQGIGGPYSADAKFVGGAGQGSDGVFAQTNGVQIQINRGQPYPADPSGRAPEVDNFVKSMQTFAPSSADISSLENVWTQNAWVEAKLLVEAISRQSQAITTKGINQYIQGLTNWKSGLVQPIASFKPDCKSGGLAWIFQWKRQPDGSLVQSDWKPYGGPIKLPASVTNALIPGSGECFVTRVADAGLK